MKKSYITIPSDYP